VATNIRLAVLKTLQILHGEGLVHGALSPRKIVMKESPKKKNESNGKVESPRLIDLGHLRLADKTARHKERKRLMIWFSRDENDTPSPSHPIEIGPVLFDFKGAEEAFDMLTSWMPQSQEPWLQTARYKFKEGKEDEWLPDPWLVVKFSSRDHVTQFQEEWSHRPLEWREVPLGDITCEDTSYNQNSRESSQAYSPAYSGPDFLEGSQADSVMAVD
jgi:hypothetical protein